VSRSIRCAAHAWLRMGEEVSCSKIVDRQQCECSPILLIGASGQRITRNGDSVHCERFAASALFYLCLIVPCNVTREPNLSLEISKELYQRGMQSKNRKAPEVSQPGRPLGRIWPRRPMRLAEPKFGGESGGIKATLSRLQPLSNPIRQHMNAGFTASV
jgi:hypothetical protein